MPMLRSVSLLLALLAGATLPSDVCAQPQVAPAPRPLQLDSFLKNRQYTRFSLQTDSSSGWRFVECEFGTRTANLLVDTGNANTCVDPKVATRHGLPEATHAQKVPKDGNPKYWRTELTIGNLRFADTLIESFDCQSYLESEKSPIRNVGGMLGRNVIAGQRAVLDCRSNSLYLPPVLGREAPATKNRDVGGVEQILKTEGGIVAELIIGKRTGRWFLRGSIAGKEATFLLDSGGGDNFLFAETAKRLGHKLADTDANRPVPDGKKSQFYQRVFAKLSIKGAAAPADIPFAICNPVMTKEGLEQDGIARCDGILGNPFLDMVGAIFDFGASRFYIQSHNFGFNDPQLNGNWRAVTVDAGDGPLAYDDANEGAVNIKANSLFRVNGGEQQEFRILTAPWKKEKWIDLIWVDHVSRLPGIYQVTENGKRLTIVCSLEPEVTERFRPTEFRSDKRKAQVVMEFDKEP